jgi:TRAP-type C4-dicarboxylate transport system permease small subunit
MNSRRHPLEIVDRGFFLLACLMAFAILVMQLGEIAARMFGGSIIVVSDMTGMLMAAMVFFALPEVTRRNEHIVADFLVDLMGERVRYLIQRFISPIASLLYVAALAWLCYQLASSSYFGGVRSPGATRMPLVIPQAALVIGLLAMLVRLAVGLWCGNLHQAEQDEPC